MPKVSQLPIFRATAKRKFQARSYALHAGNTLENAGAFANSADRLVYTYLLQIHCLYPEICFSQQKVADRIGMKVQQISLICKSLQKSTYQGNPLLRVVIPTMYNKKIGRKYHCLAPSTGDYQHEFE